MITYKCYMTRKYLDKIESDPIIKSIITIIYTNRFPNYRLFNKLENYFKFLKVSNEVMQGFYLSYIGYIKECSQYTYRDYEREDIIKSINKKLGVLV